MSNIQIGLGAAVHLLRRQVGPVHGRGLDPGVHGVAGDPQVQLAELVGLGPAEGRVPQPLLHDGVEPGEEEVHLASTMPHCSCGGVIILAGKYGNTEIPNTEIPGGRYGGEGADEVGLDAGRRLVREDAAVVEQVDRDLGVDLAGEEQAEAVVGRDRVELLLAASPDLHRGD